ncbi:hypothetical protein P0082_09850 [Candidatus Haliotispira prima]|uniref:Receptor ligand binding region domain-containing protein n=1 Tax=Candidatus Haliotispira prima TaxID=3034016 RepID=A0ABY8MFL7_9SPIO|nr:hypothetical protein P0082_09850 [Candidatus Haliotispira prima]
MSKKILHLFCRSGSSGMNSLRSSGKAADLLWAVCLLFLLTVACSGQPVAEYKMVLVQDSSEESWEDSSQENRSGKVNGASEAGLKEPLVVELKAAKLAIERFNAETDINNLVLELEVLDLAKVEIDSTEALQSYVNQLQRSNSGGRRSQQQRSVVVGFVIGRGESSLLRGFVDLFGSKDMVLLGSWPSGLPETEGENPLLLNMAKPRYGGNKYLLQYIDQHRNLDSLYVVYDEDNRDKAGDFLARSHSTGLSNLVELEYTNGRGNYNEGRIRSLAELLGNQRVTLQNSEKNSGVVLFLDQQNANEVNRYLAKSPYRYFFDRLDFILNGNTVSPAELTDPDSPRYFVFRQLQDADSEQNYRRFEHQYEKNYHLRAGDESAYLFDKVTLLAYTVKKTVEGEEMTKISGNSLYQDLLETQFKGSTGDILFDEKGQRLVGYAAFRFTGGIFKRIGYFPAGQENFVTN